MNPIATMGTLLSGIDFQSRQSYAVARIGMDQARSEGEAVNKMIEDAARIAPANDPNGSLGHHINTYA